MIFNSPISNYINIAIFGEGSFWCRKALHQTSIGIIVSSLRNLTVARSCFEKKRQIPRPFGGFLSLSRPLSVRTSKRPFREFGSSRRTRRAFSTSSNLQTRGWSSTFNIRFTPELTTTPVCGRRLVASCVTTTRSFILWTGLNSSAMRPNYSEMVRNWRPQIDRT